MFTDISPLRFSLKELMSLALYPDDVVQENAVEAIAEMCTIPAIQVNAY